MKRIILLLLPYLGGLAVLINYYLIPDNSIYGKTSAYPILIAVILLYYTVRWIILRLRNHGKFDEYVRSAPKLFALLIAFTLWDVLTAKTKILPAPYFQQASRIVDALAGNWQTLIIDMLYSLRLLFLGYICGLAAGFLTGMVAGWYPKVRYWVMPIVKKIGPVPSTIWIPFILILIPTLFAGSVFLIAFGVWFPVTLMTATGIMSVPSSYFEVARTLGASRRYLLLRVALPATLPNLFMGAFMGMSISCVTLISAEGLGTKAGLGLVISRAIAWAEWNKVYAGVILILITFSTVISLLFKLNRKLLKWQKDVIQW